MTLSFKSITVILYFVEYVNNFFFNVKYYSKSWVGCFSEAEYMPIYIGVSIIRYCIVNHKINSPKQIPVHSTQSPFAKQTTAQWRGIPLYL